MFQLHTTSGPLLLRPPLLHYRSGHIRGTAFLEGDYNGNGTLAAQDGGLWRGGGGTVVPFYITGMAYTAFLKVNCDRINFVSFIYIYTGPTLIAPLLPKATPVEGTHIHIETAVFP